jgi:phosphatidylserine/phosphatidylglycerophosphate/cardiolipin synthase-like enzyme
VRLRLSEALADASWRGVDVRVVVGGSRDNYQIAAIAAAARAVLADAGVPTRWLSARPGRGSHAKLIISDDFVLTGSHNWSPGAFDGSQVQDSVVVSSPSLAGALHMHVFEPQWLTAET